MENFDSVVSVKKEHSEDEFIREVLILLATNADTPVDVVNAKFGEVKERTREAILCTAHVESDYSASIGYDRTEEYWDKVQKTDRNGNKYWEDVKKTRTVTDWKPYSGHIGGDATTAALNEKENDDDFSKLIDDHDELTTVLKTIKKESIVGKGDATINQDGLETAKMFCRFDVEGGINYPGDHHKDERSNADVEVNHLSCFILPFYEVDFEYQGKTYHACCFACGSMSVQTEYPQSSINVSAVATEKTKNFKTGSIVLWAVFGVLFVLAVIMCFVGVFWMWALAAVGLVAAIVMHVMSDKKYNAEVQRLTTNTVQAKQQELGKVLAKRNLDSLSADENSSFNADSAATSAVYQNKRKGVKIPAILCSIATVILAIASIVANVNSNSQKLHSPDKFTVLVTNKTAEQKTDGYAYVYLDFKITSKDIGSKAMQVTTYVYKDNSSIGSVNTSFSNMNLDANKSATYSTYIKDSKTTTNTFFVSLYNTNYSSLSFKYEITSITFSDGKYYSK
jgi:hypothetical protein